MPAPSDDLPQASRPISAAILAGGASRRMGTDKALIDWHGRPLIHHVVDTLRSLGPLIDDVSIVGVRPGYATDGAALVEDDHPGAGPLGGIATAIRVARRDQVLVVGCDMPLLNAYLIEAMIRLAPDCPNAIVPVLGAGRGAQGGRQTFETLHAIYPRSCLSVVERQIESGNLKVADLFESVPVCRLDEEWIRTYDPELMSFINVNTPEELWRAEAYYRLVAGDEG